VDQIGWSTLIGSYLPRLRNFAERHLPPETRGALGPDDVVQDVVMRGMRHVQRFELRHEGALVAYLRASIRHRIVDEIRKAKRRPMLVPLEGYESLDRGASPLDRLISRSQARRYRHALAGLSVRDRRLIELRVEQGLSYEEIAVRLGMRSESSVRMALRRALYRLGVRVNRSTPTCTAHRQPGSEGLMVRSTPSAPRTSAGLQR
jgi:RNA polymerase sigma-70 factor (ECF subfamily)